MTASRCSSPAPGTRTPGIATCRPRSRGVTACAVSPAFALTRDIQPVVESICRRLDCLPLAVQLAARLVRLLPVDGILAGLDDRFALLISGTRDADTRHRDLSAAIAWSYGLLSLPRIRADPRHPAGGRVDLPSARLPAARRSARRPAGAAASGRRHPGRPR